MKRSNRLVLLVGVFLAVIAFVGVLLLSQGPPDDPNQPPTEATVVVAAEDIPLGTVIEEAMVTTETVPVDGALPGDFTATSEVIGQIARQEVLTGQQITTAVTNQGQVPTNVTVPNGYRAVSVLVDQLTGVGTLIQTGDYVDVLVRFEIQPNDIDEETGVATPVQGIDTTSTKLLIQGMQVIGVVRPPPPRTGRRSHARARYDAQRAAGARDPVGHAGPGRGAQVRRGSRRPDRHAGPALAGGLHRRERQPAAA